MALGEKRFIKTENETMSGFGIVTVLVDTETGVQYLYTGGGGVTVLVDEDGRPLVNDKLKRK